MRQEEIPAEFRQSEKARLAFDFAYNLYLELNPPSPLVSSMARLDQAQKAGMRAVRKLWRKLG